MKKEGSMAQFGRKFKISDVKLDIAIPKGYNKSLLRAVEIKAEARASN